MKHNLTGKRFGRFTVTGETQKVKRWYKWRCICDCGNERYVLASSLTGGLSKSCGCYNIEAIGNRSRTHGGTANGGACKEYKAWCHAKSRCCNPKDGKYLLYGGRGIRMSEDWLGSYGAFFRDMGACPDPKFSLERVDLHGNYCKENCIWASAHVQSRNKTTNVWMPNGMILTDFCDHFGLDRKKFSYHFRARKKSIAAAARKCGVTLLQFEGVPA